MDEKIDRPTWVSVTIIVAIIGCIGALGASFIGILPDILTSYTTETPHENSSPIPDINLSIYDDFENPAYDNAFNPALWEGSSNNPNQFTYQKNGVMVISQSGMPQQGTSLNSRKYSYVVLDKPIAVEARLMLDTKEHQNSSQDSGAVAITWIAHTNNGEQWISQCQLIGDNPDLAGILCSDWWNTNSDQGIKVMDESRVNYGKWYTFQIKIDPSTMTTTYYIDGNEVGSFIPLNADKLVGAKFELTLNVWTNSADTITGYIDDVRINNFEVSP